MFINSNTKKKYYTFEYYSGKNKFKIPLLKNQISDLKKTLNKLEKIFFIDFKNLNISLTIENHINANCIEGNEILNSKSNYLIIGAGSELKNRLVSSIFKQNNKKIIQIAHGDSYGVFDEPVWSEIGDQYNADFIIGYGKGYKENTKLNLFKTNKNANYLGGSSKTILNIIKIKSNNNSKEFKFIYFPTTFSGISKRYGPHRDMPDKLYIDSNADIKLFKKNIILKYILKNNYLNL